MPRALTARIIKISLKIRRSHLYLVLQQEAERPYARASIIFRSKKPSRFVFRSQPLKEFTMTKEQDNKTIVGRWFTDFWGKTCNLNIVDELAAPKMLLQYSLHWPRRGL